MPDVDFTPVDLDGGLASLTSAVSGASLVVHTAGPFQGRQEPSLLKACLAAGVPYCDVCDELVLSRNAKALSAEAKVPCVVSCGIWPGVSALMAAEAVSRMGGKGSCERLEFSFYTAGTGGAGPTIVSATFAARNRGDVLREWQARWFGAVDRAEGHGLWSRHWGARVLLIGQSRRANKRGSPRSPQLQVALGTAPSFWNNLFGAMKVLPKDLLYDKGKMQGLALFSMPIIRTVDALVGSTNAMRVDAYKAGESTTPAVTLRCVHDDLEDCVGQATAAFGMELLRGREGGVEGVEATVEDGVWYPAELSETPRRNILEVARERTLVWEV